MSIEASYRRVTPRDFSKLQSDPKAASSFFGTNLDDLDLDNPEALLAKMQEQESSNRYLGIGTDWHALHFLLTGDGELGERGAPPRPPLGNAVQGGTETEWDCTYGHVRSLMPDEVRAVADALGKISVEDLRSRFSVAAFNAAGIYPHGRDSRWTTEEAESVFDVYPQVVEFFQLAAKDGDIILLSSD